MFFSQGGLGGVACTKITRGGLVHQSVINLQASLAEIAFYYFSPNFSLKEKNFFVFTFPFDCASDSTV